MIKATMLVAMLLSTQTVLGQEPEPLPVIQSTATLVTLPALIRQPSGEIVKNPDTAHFQLFDNGIAQKFSVENASDEPIGLAILIQTGGAGALAFENYRRLPSLLQSIVGNSPHEIMLMTFDSRVEEIWHFPPRSDGLLHSLDHSRSGDDGVAILDAVNYAVDLFQQEPGKFQRIVLLISQARDEGSKTATEEVIRNLGKGSTTVYCLTSPPHKNRPAFRSKKKESMPNETHSGHHRYNSPSAPIDTSTPLGAALKAMQRNTAAELADLSGGEDLKFHNEQDFEQQISAIAEDIRNRSLLTFHPSSHNPGFHLLRLQEIGHSTHVGISARTSYWFDTNGN